MQELRMAVEKVVHEVVMGSRSTTATRRALLPHLATLALLLGRKCDFHAFNALDTRDIGIIVLLQGDKRHSGAGEFIFLDLSDYTPHIQGLPNPISKSLKARLTPLCCRETNDFLLPVVITFLNSPDWQLRAAFFEHVGCLGPVAGPISIQAFLFPCLPQASTLGIIAFVLSPVLLLSFLGISGNLQFWTSCYTVARSNDNPKSGKVKSWDTLHPTLMHSWYRRWRTGRRR